MMYRIEMYVDGSWWPYGTYKDRDRANEIAMVVRDERRIWVRVVEC